LVRQSPRNFGIARTRWTLQLLAQTVPGLQGLCPSAVWHALRRLGISYKRAEPWLHSPDPDYVKKNSTSKRSWRTPGKPRKT
jgi:transposase